MPQKGSPGHGHPLTPDVLHPWPALRGSAAQQSPVLHHPPAENTAGGEQALSSRAENRLHSRGPVGVAPPLRAAESHLRHHMSPPSPWAYLAAFVEV